MTFKRSPSGLRNIHVFKGVDLVIYTEGGGQKGLTKEEILNGAGYEQSDDIKFWSKVFSIFRPSISIKCLSVGSCSTLREIAGDIFNGDLSHVCVAMDKDYSCFWGDIITHRNVIYSRTYSWENELFHSEVMFRTFQRIALEDFDSPTVDKSIKTAHDLIVKQLRPFFFADLVLVAAHSSFFSRRQSGACFVNVNRGTAFPEVDVIRMRKEMNQRRAEIHGFRLIRNPTEWNVARDIYGKPLLYATHRILQHLISQAGQKSLPNDYLNKFLIESLGDWIDEEPASDIAQYYNNEINSVA